jgi:hypothetical protein
MRSVGKPPPPFAFTVTLRVAQGRFAMSRFPLFALTLFALTASGCSRDVLRPVDAPPAGDTRQVAKIPHIDRTELDQMLQQAMMPDGWLAVIGEGRKMVEVPDGSVDALADAIAMAGPNGVVLLKAGTHTETGTVQIPFRVHLVGEEGAELVTSAGGLDGARTPRPGELRADPEHHVPACVGRRQHRHPDRRRESHDAVPQSHGRLPVRDHRGAR